MVNLGPSNFGGILIPSVMDTSEYSKQMMQIND